MASSDDEVDTQPLFVSNYHFEDDKDVPVSFSVLPIQWSESESLDGKKEKVFLRGFADNGLRKIFMQVIAWRFDLSNVKTEISVLSKDRRWVKLQKPRKSYEEIIRTILITVQFLHYVKKNPEASAKSVWDNMSKNNQFSSYEVMPSQKDLLNHMALMGEAAKRDAVLANSKLLLMVLEDKSKARIKKLSDEDVKDLARPGFIIDDVDDDAIGATAEETDEEEEDDLFDSVCSFCDNGGELLICDGKCMRSFHACEEDGEDSSCVSLGLSRKEVDENPNFYCKNCEYNQHQCFACGELGCSDKFTGAEVFKCASATCGFFYHPQCVARLLHREDENARIELKRNIARGEPFTCPAHYCCICKGMENKQEHELQFAVCRRCPKSYHRKCLPRKIAFDDGEEEDIVARAWEGLLPNNRILLYCLKHAIDDELKTPIRDHIKFPNVKAPFQQINTKEKTKPVTKERVMLKKNNVELDDLLIKRTSAEVSTSSGKMSSGTVDIKRSGKISGSNIPRKKANEASRRSLNENKRSFLKETERSEYEKNQPSLGVQLYALYQKGSQQINSGNRVDNVADNTPSVKPTRKLSSTSSQLDADSERRLLALYKEATSSITLENVIKEHKFVSTHTHSLKTVVEKTITTGKLEGSVEAVRTALRMLNDGHSIRDAEAVCGPDVLNRLFKWKDKLKVYLAPVLYGNRYTSFGRHFTQIEKLEGIIDKLHWYVQNGDTIVDFCCGANDFSILMKKKLEETGKSCSYKNYDLLPTKNDFNFEVRDWMTVKRKELPTGSRLIMGLNPPFGLKAALANKFIDKALEFEPKLLILIVPQETERLDRKRPAYDLVWEDERFLSGKSFYLPGSVGTNDKQLDDWNIRPPPLYLWSHPKWTVKHKLIAQEHGHLLSKHDSYKSESFDKGKSSSSHTMDDDMKSHDLLLELTKEEDHTSMIKDQMKSSFDENVDRESQDHLSENTSWKRKRTGENDGRGPAVTSAIKRQATNEMLEEDHPKSDSIPPDIEVGDSSHRHLEPSSFSHTEVGAAHSVASPILDYGVRDSEEYHSRQPIHSQGLQIPDSIWGNYLSGHDPAYHMGSTYSVLGSGSQLPYMTTTPAMQRYAPRLDEINPVRMDSLGSEPPIMSRYGPFEHSAPQPGYGNGPHPLGPEPPIIGRIGTFEQSVPQPGYGNGPGPHPLGPEPPIIGRIGTFEQSVPQPGYGNGPHPLGPEPPIVGRAGSFERSMSLPGHGNGPQGFATDPHHLYSRQNSAGWFNE